MIEESPLSQNEEHGSAPVPSVRAGVSAATGRPWITVTIVALCTGIWLDLNFDDNGHSWQSLARWGTLPASDIWNGAYWGLLPGVFVHLALWHLALWHLAFNMYWLWILGSRLESAIGHVRFLGFYLAAGIISSSFQLALSDSTGIGASGVVYAIFGFMWPTRNHFRSFQEVLDQRTANIFMIWLVGCLIATLLDIWNVGNAAHFSGLLFGRIVAEIFVLRTRKSLMSAALAGMLICAVVPLVWCPWSVAWLSNKAYHAHSGEHYRNALDLYTRVIQRDPQNAWAYMNRGLVYDALNDPEKAERDKRKAREIDPTVEKE